MVQLRMHVTGDAERTISGLGSQGIMYATALKTLKENLASQASLLGHSSGKSRKEKKISPMTGKPFVSSPLIRSIACNASPYQLLRRRQRQWQSPKDCQMFARSFDWKAEICGYRHQRKERNPSTGTYLQFCEETCQGGIWFQFRRRSQDGYFKKHRLSQRR